jgi:cytochrome c peroxidase
MTNSNRFKLRVAAVKDKIHFRRAGILFWFMALAALGVWYVSGPLAMGQSGHSAPESGSASTQNEQPATPPAQTFETKRGTLQQKVQAANSIQEEAIHPPAESPRYFGPVYRSALKAPRPAHVYNQGGVPPVVPENETDNDPTGKIGSYQPGGPTKTSQNAFFASLGTNGRSCITCHQPPNGMSVSVKNIDDRYNATGGTDPIFDPIDGSNCPLEVPASETSGSLSGGHLGGGKKAFKDSHSLILTKGLFRIFLPVPANADYTIKVLSDPYGCNTTAPYNTETDPKTGSLVQLVSVYRRPLVSTNLIYVTKTRIDTLNPATGQPNSKPVDPVTGQPLPVDPATGNPVGGNIMWDGREPTLATQAVDATLGHAQASQPPTAAQVQQIVDFETGIYSAQVRTNSTHSLTAAGGLGGPAILYGYTANAGVPAATVVNPVPPPATFAPTFFLYNAWQTLTNSVEQFAQRESVFRGQQIFNGKQFTISNVAGLNNIATSPGNTLGPITGSCSSCHNQVSAGSDSFPAAQHDLGIAGDNPNFNGPSPSTDLPIFQVTCTSGAPTGFHASVITTNDPGLALITGRCADVGRLSVAPLRGLASHAPYFSDGSAATLNDVVDFYNKRFSIGLSNEEKQDLVNFLNSL